MWFIEKALYSLFPKLILQGTPWERIWNEQERKNFIFSARIFFAVTFLGYILHYFTVDRYEGLAPSTLWFRYRFGMAAISAVCLTFYSFPKLNKKLSYYRLPAVLACACFCYFQSRTVIWYPKVPYLYSYAFIVISTLVLRTSLTISATLSFLYCALVWPAAIEAGNSEAMIFSASFLAVAIVVIARTSYLSDLNFFLLTQKNIEQQKKIIEINVEFTNQIKAFLPARISSRMLNAISSQNLNVTEAVDEVLRARQLEITCLFSDIRGFTQASRDLSGFVSKSVLPNVKACTQALEDHGGIPRKIGDLLFAYFDDNTRATNLMNCLKAAIEIKSVSTSLNDSLPEHLRLTRYILLSFGRAIVGNLSSYDSSIEITAIGPPVNLLNRIDEVTKQQVVKSLLQSGSIILDPSFSLQLRNLCSEFELNEINLRQLGVKIRDFEEIDYLYVFPDSLKNREILSEVTNAHLTENEAA